MADRNHVGVLLIRQPAVLYELFARRAGQGSLVEFVHSSEAPVSWCPRYCVVVPVDFSDLSFSAIDTALELVDDPSHVHVIHVLPPIAVVETGASWREMDEETRRRNAHASATERLAGPRYSGIDIHIAVGEAGQEIAAYADRNHADVIVLSSHGRTGPGRVLIGSIAERIVRLARCPVLVLRWRSALDGS